jgi:putative ABC transport system permease protein
MNRQLASLFVAQWLRHPGFAALSVLAIALGVALGVGVSAINRSALNEFAHGVRLLSGSADLEVRGGRAGFDETVYPMLARLPQVERAAPALEIEARVPGRDESLRVLGIDPLRAAAVQPALVSFAQEDFAGRYGLLDPQVIHLSPAAARWLGVEVGDTVVLQSGLRLLEFRLGALLPAVGEGRRLGVIDVAAAQARFERLGTLSRIDLRLRAGADPDGTQRAVTALLPAGVFAFSPEQNEDRAAALSRAYRVNLTMLALIALVTGGFLVFSTQALSVVRRRQEFALLRALGLTRGELLAWLIGEGAAAGALGAAIGLGLGYGLAAAVLAWVGGDLGAGYFEGLRPVLAIDPLATLTFALLGTAAAAAGAAAPAFEAAHSEPARALRAGDAQRMFQRFGRLWPGMLCLALAAAACVLPPVSGLPLFGYAAVALLIAGAVLLLPRLAARVFSLGRLPQRAAPQLAFAQLRHAPGQVVVAAAGILASVAVASAMAIMVASFRDSVDAWLDRVLPADLYVRASRAGESGHLDPAAQRAIAGAPGVARADFLRHRSLALDPGRPPVALIARAVPAQDPARVVPLTTAAAASGARDPVWVSEAMVDLYGARVGSVLALPLAGREHRFEVAGVWRDYARQHGAVVIDLERYREITGDLLANDAAIVLAAGADPAQVALGLRAALAHGENLEIADPGEIRRLSLGIFDRTFAVTYGLEAVAILIGLAGVATSFAALAAARRREFGMLRHVGMRRREIAAMLAIEGAAAAGLGVAAGMAIGAAIAWVLVEVVNRQSFHWSMDLVVPWMPLAGFALAMVLLAAGAAVFAGRRAMQADAIRAVREDW